MWFCKNWISVKNLVSLLKLKIISTNQIAVSLIIIFVRNESVLQDFFDGDIHPGKVACDFCFVLSEFMNTCGSIEFQTYLIINCSWNNQLMISFSDHCHYVFIYLFPCIFHQIYWGLISHDIFYFHRLFVIS